MLLRYLVFSVLFLSVVCKKPSIELQRDEDNVPVFPNAQLTSVHEAETKKLSCPERRLAICSFDCTYIQFCVNGYISNTITIECPNGTLCDQNKHTPVCSKNIGSCISTNITVKTDVQPPTVCDKPKYTRDLEDCRNYTYCDTTGTYSYRCQNSTVFDEKTLKCVKNLKCVSFGDKPGGLCFKKTEKNYVSDPTNEKRYIKCTNPPRFIFCPDKYVFNQVKQGCEFKCLKEGRFKDPLDETNRIFFECRKGSINGDNLFPIERKCPEGTAFNTRTGVCLLDNKIKVKTFSVNTTNSSIKTMSMTQQIICPLNHTYNRNTHTCEYVCKEEGNQPDTTDPNGLYYYQCNKTDEGFVSEKKMCQEGLLFDFVTRDCIKNLDDLTILETKEDIDKIKPEVKELRNVKDKITSVRDKVNEFTGKIKLIQGELKKKKKPNSDEDEEDIEEEITDETEEDDVKEIRAIKNIFDLNKQIKKDTVYIKNVEKSPEDKKTAPKNPQKSCNSENYDYNPNTKTCEFVCPKEGFFPDFKDSSHVKYYECLSQEEGLIAVHRTCPEMTKFNIYSKVCLVTPPNVPDFLKFECKEGYEFNSTSKKCQYKCKSEGRFRSLDNEKSYYDCIKGDGEFLSVEKNCEEENVEICSAFEIMEAVEEQEVPVVFEGDTCQFNCANEGLFANPEDPTKYYECTSGNEKNAFCRNCPEMTTFDPIEKMCVLNSGNFELKCKEGFVFKKESQSCEVVCDEEGLFKDVEDLSGSYYYACSMDTLKDEIVVVRKKCDDDTIFDEKQKKCVNENVEKIEVKNSNTNKESEMIQISTLNATKCNHINYVYVSEKDFCQFVCPTEGRYPDFLDSSGIKYYECISSSDDSKNLTANHLICPEGTVFNPRARICSFATPEIPTDLKECPPGYRYVIDSLSCEFICPEQGLFLDPADPTKSHYYECVCIHPGSKEVFPARKKCGGITTFDENKQICNEPEETSVDTITCSTGYKFNPTNRECEFDCKLEGKFLDPADTTGIYYFECVTKNDGEFSAERRKCPEMTTFNHVVGICIFLIGNMNQIMNESNNETIFCKHKNYEYDPESGKCEFVCPDEGQFADLKDGSNVKYYECLKDAENGKILGVHRLCPDMTVFNAVAGVCSFLSPASMCPKGLRFNFETQKCEFSCEKEGFFKDEGDDLDVYYFECRKDVSTNKTLATRLRCSLGEVFSLEKSKCVVKECESSDFIYNAIKGMCVFKCPYEGRFRDLKDKKNLWYYECVKTGGDMVSFHKICPEETTFDPVMRICHDGLKEMVSESTVCFEGYKFDEARQVCEFRCEKEGRFVDWADATSVHYYECIKISRSKKFTVIRRKCFGRTTFDSIAGICLSPLRRTKNIS